MNPARSGDYLSVLADEIRAGVAQLPDRLCKRQRAFIRQAQNEDGGFSGRMGGSDLYYTHFGLRSADALDLPSHDSLWRAAARYVGERADSAADVTDCFCAARARALLKEHNYRVSDRGAEGAFRDRAARLCGPAADGEAGVYGLFLAQLAARELGLDGPSPDVVERFVRARRCDDGGFANQEASGPGGVNPTAAAVALLGACGALDEATGRELTDFLAGLQRPDGGFPAHGAAPFSDLMSTFTALVALRDLGGMDRTDLAAAARFAGGLRSREGGFCGAEVRDAPDVEYTFYGLGTLGMLSAYAARSREGTRENPAEGLQ